MKHKSSNGFIDLTVLLSIFITIVICLTLVWYSMIMIAESHMNKPLENLKSYELEAEITDAYEDFTLIGTVTNVDYYVDLVINGKPLTVEDYSLYKKATIPNSSNKVTLIIEEGLLDGSPIVKYYWGDKLIAVRDGLSIKEPVYISNKELNVKYIIKSKKDKDNRKIITLASDLTTIQVESDDLFNINSTNVILAEKDNKYFYNDKELTLLNVIEE